MAIASLFFALDNIQTVALCVGVFVLLAWSFKKPRNTPPGPMRWPILGSFHTLILSIFVRKEQIHELMTRLSSKYGKVFSFHMGSSGSTIVLNDANIIKEAFQKKELFARPSLDFIFGKNTEHSLKRAGLTNGETWTQHRRFSLSVFRNAGVGKSSFSDQISSEAALLGDAIEQLYGKPFDPKPVLMNATSNIICSIVLGKRFDYDDIEFRQLLQLIPERPKLAQKMQTLSNVPVPFIRNLLLRKYAAQISENLRRSTSFVRSVIEDHKGRFQDENDCQDFIDLYLREIMGKQDQNECKNNFTEDYLNILTDILFAAGTETSSNTLAWCLLRLIAEPDIQQQIRDEIIATCGEDRLTTYSDRSKMPFTEAFLLEVQRLYTIIPLGVPHYASETTTLQGYTIPEGSTVLSNLWAVHHDPEVWNDPDEFKPTRFLAQDGKIMKKEEFMPFSAGRRMCAGERIAKMELFIFLTHLVRRFHFKNADTASSLTFKGKSGVTYAPPDFQISAEKVK